MICNFKKYIGISGFRTKTPFLFIFTKIEPTLLIFGRLSSSIICYAIERYNYDFNTVL